MPATIFMPTTASLPKVKATQDYGARVRFVDGVLDDAVNAAKEFARRVDEEIAKNARAEGGRRP